MINTLHLCDALSLLNQLPDSSIDLIAIDPPYKINYQDCSWDEGHLDWPSLSSQFFRVIKPTGNIIIFQGWTNVCNTIQTISNELTLKNWIIYDRVKGRGAITNLVSTREDILWYVKTDAYTYNKIPSTIEKKTKGMGAKNGCKFRALSNVWTDISPIVPWSNEKEDHPTQKPLKLMDRIISIYSNENDTVLDCFAGSGTTLVSAKNLGRNYIGCENNKAYFDIACERLK